MENCRRAEHLQVDDLGVPLWLRKPWHKIILVWSHWRMSGAQNKLWGLDPDGYQNRPKNDLFAQNLWRAGTSQNRASIFSFFKPFPHYSFLVGKWFQQHGLMIPVEPLGWVEAIIATSWKPQDCRPTPLSSNMLECVWRFRILKQFLLCHFLWPLPSILFTKCETWWCVPQSTNSF